MLPLTFEGRGDVANLGLRLAVHNHRLHLQDRCPFIVIGSTGFSGLALNINALGFQGAMVNALLMPSAGQSMIDMPGPLFAPVAEQRPIIPGSIFVAEAGLGNFSQGEHDMGVLVARITFAVRRMDGNIGDHATGDAAVIADGLVLVESGEGAHFADRARDCLATAIEVAHALEGPKATLHDVRKLVLSATFSDTLVAWADTPDLAGGRAADLAGSFLQMGEKERGAIISTVARSLKWTAAEHMRTFLAAEKGFQLDMLLGGETDLFIVVPLDQIGPQAGFLRLLTNQLLALMVQQDQRGKAEKPVLFVADEFTRLGYLQRVVDIATVAAGMNLETIFVLQDRGSLEAIYGQYAADTILGSCATTRVFNLGRADLRTAEWLSKASGYKTMLTEGKSVQSTTVGQTTSKSEVKEALLSVSDILELPADRIICLIRGKAPAKIGRIFYFKDQRYRIQK